MKHMKTVQVPAETLEVEDFTTCDLCKQRIAEPSHYDVNEVEVRHKTGSSYPEGGNGEEVRVDMCPTCFTNKLVPWLRSQGADVRTEDWDW